jgi:S-layer homology domain
MKHLGYTTLVLLVATLAACSGQSSASSNSGATPAAEATIAIASSATPSASVVAAATAAASPGVAVKTVSFSDINGIFAEQAIRDLAALGVFETTSGAFGPSKTISRALFVRWLIKADNAFNKDPAHQIRLAEDKVATFVDVPASRPDFKYVQGLANSGYVIGIDAKHFQPDRPITREEMVAIKAQVDEGGTITPVDVMFISGFGDAKSVNKRYTGAIHEDSSVRTSHNIGRVYGNIKMLQPQKPVTRAEAAIALSVIADKSAAVALGRTPAP